MRSYLYYVDQIRKKPYTKTAFQEEFEDYQRHLVPDIFMELGTDTNGKTCSFTDALPDTQFLHFEPCPAQYQKLKTHKDERLELFQKCAREQKMQMNTLCFHDNSPYTIDRLKLYYEDEIRDFDLESITFKQSKHVLPSISIENFLKERKLHDCIKTLKINSRRLTLHFIQGWPRYLRKVRSLVIHCDDSGRQAYTADYFIDRLYQLDFIPTALSQMEPEKTALHFVSREQ